MKNNIIGYTLLALLFLFPFRYAIEGHTGILWLFSMIASVLSYAALLFIFISKPFANKKVVQPVTKAVTLEPEKNKLPVIESNICLTNLAEAI